MILEEIYEQNKDQSGLKIADKASRFINFLIDLLGFILIAILISFIFEAINTDKESTKNIRGIISLILYVIYKTAFEYKTGKTPGKFVTRTHVVTINNEKPSFKNLLIRNICRLVPFDQISILFSDITIHDNLSKTRVVKD